MAANRHRKRLANLARDVEARLGLDRRWTFLRSAPPPPKASLRPPRSCDHDLTRTGSPGAHCRVLSTQAAGCVCHSRPVSREDETALITTRQIRRTWVGPLALLAIVALAQGCARPTRPPARQYAVDQTGAAKSCTASKPDPAPGKETQAKLEVKNDGGWCAIAVAQPGPMPCQSRGSWRAARGTARSMSTPWATIPGSTTPLRPNYAGPDSFTVRLLPGGALLKVDATVTK